MCIVKNKLSPSSPRHTSVIPEQPSVIPAQPHRLQIDISAVIPAQAGIQRAKLGLAWKH